MARDFGSSGFSTANRFIDQEEADPRVGLVNLADVMLVFACGLMLALVVKWNIDLPDMKEFDSSTMEEIDDVEETQDIVDSATSSYMELGTVYQDPNTGKLYMMTQTDKVDAATANETPGAAERRADAASGSSASDGRSGATGGSGANADAGSASADSADAASTASGDGSDADEGGR